MFSIESTFDELAQVERIDTAGERADDLAAIDRGLRPAHGNPASVLVDGERS